MPRRQPNKNHGHELDTSDTLWRDKRTGIAMAPGAVCNWATSKDIALIKKYAHLATKRHEREDDERFAKLRLTCQVTTCDVKM